jgi:hypothetical protein
MTKKECHNIVGEFRKTYHPRNVEFYEIREMGFQESRTCEIWNLEPAKLQSRKLAEI